MSRDIFTVSRLNEEARAVLEHEIGTIWVEGEVSNLARPSSGHIYFSLKDASAQLRCAMFRRRNAQLGFEMRDGLHILAHGGVSLYTARGDFQLIVESIEPAGEGLLRLKFEQLKRKLSEEGLFDVEHKREIPTWPRAIGVVSSATGAAVRDVLTVLQRRCPAIPVIIYPTSVQGESAAGQIAAAIERASRRQDCDVLIVGRGGGSLEDLWAFNEERVARAIHAAAIPVVSAVGHEIDFTIADLVADRRAPTPSAAAELASPDMLEVNANFVKLSQRLNASMTLALKARHTELRQLTQRLVSPRRRLESHFQRLDELLQRLPNAMGTQIKLRHMRLQTLLSRVNAESPRSHIDSLGREVTHVRQRLTSAIRLNLANRSQALERFMGILRAVGPTATLERGYAIVTDRSGNIVTNAGALKLKDEVTTRLAGGRFRSSVTSTENE